MGPCRSNSQRPQGSSPQWTGVRVRISGRRSVSTTAYSVVVRPLRERPITWCPGWWALPCLAVERDAPRSVRLTLLELRLQLDALQLGALQLGEDTFQDAPVNPASAAHVNWMPGSEPLGQGSLATAFFRHKQPSSTSREGSVQFPRGVGMRGTTRSHCASVSGIFPLVRPPNRHLTLTQAPIRVNRH